MTKRLIWVCMITAAVLSGNADTPVKKSGGRSGTLKSVPMRTIASARLQSSEAPLPLPATFPLSTKDEIDSYAKVDGNTDGMTWKYESGYPTGSALCEGNSTLDDWLILPAIDFTNPAGSFSLSLEAKQLVQPETFEVCLSPSTDVAEAFVVYSCAKVPNISFGQLNADFSVPAPGAYHVMIHATSNPAGISLNIKNIQITVNAPQNFTVSFTMVPESDEAKYFSFIDTNNDGKCWKYDTNNKGIAYENAANTVDADDYVVFPEIQIDEPGHYKFSLDANGYGSSIEGMEIRWGQGEDPTEFETVFTDKKISTPAYRREVVINVNEPGLYRVALHAISTANAYKLLTKNFSLVATDEPLASPLPMEQTGDINVGSTGSFSHAFILPAPSRVKISFEAQGGALSVGLGNAPVAAACPEIFTTEAAEDFTAVSRVMNLNRDGINYLHFTSEGEAVVRNLKVQIFTEEDEAYQLPFNMQPTAMEFNEFSVVNSNDDDATWTYYEQFGAARYNWSNTAKADDWLILPAINVPDEGKMLKFTLKVRGMAVTLPETFEIWAGRTANPEEMTLLYTSPEVRTEEFTPFEFSFTPTWSGITYLAVHATSEPKMFHLFVRDFVLDYDGRTTGVPKPVSELTAVAASEGQLSANLSLMLPSLTEGGDMISAETTLNYNVTTPAGSFDFTGAAGSAQNISVATVQGDNEITVTVSNSAGESNPVKVNVYTGQDRPAAIENLTLTASENNRSVHLSWTLPENGVDGGYVDPAQVTYVVRHAIGSNSYTKAGEVEGNCEFDFTIPDTYPLEMHYFIIVPQNVAGDGEVGKGSGIVLGRPHSIPSVEEMNGAIELGPVGMSNPDESYTLDWYFDNPASAFDEAANASGFALIAFTEEPGAARGRLHLPKFDTRTTDGARLILRLFNYPHFAPTDVYGVDYQGNPVFISRIEPSAVAEWHEYSLPLPAELMNRSWVEFYLDFGFDGSYNDEIWMLDRYGLENYFDRELEVRPLLAPSVMNAQQSATWRFSVGNYGRESVSFAVPELNFTTESGDVCSFKAKDSSGNITLNPGESMKFNYDVELDVAFEGTIAYDLSIPVEGDGNPENNFAVGEVLVRMQDEFVVRDLSAVRDEKTDDVKLTWSAPKVDAYGIFYSDNLDSWDYSSQLGLFTNYDADGIPTMRFVGAAYPGMGAPKAWQVWDYKDAGFDVIYAGYLGTDKSLIVFGPGDGVTPADDWLISPEVKGGTMLTFYVRPLHFAYGAETIEILTSNTGSAPEDFTLLTTYHTQEGDRDKTPYWEEVETMLPEDARFFAIRYVSCNIFGLQLDDIIYTPAQSETSDLTYSVFRDGKVIASGLKETEYADPYRESATYHVAAEKAYGGLHPLSNRATADASGVGMVKDGVVVTVVADRLIVSGVSGMEVTVSGANGAVVYATSGAPERIELPLGSGVYIVKAGYEPVVKTIIP